MLTQKDLQEVKNLIDEAVGQIIKAVGKALEDFATKDDIRRLDGRLDKVDGRLDKVDGRLDKMGADIVYIKRDVGDLKADMPTKEDFKTLKKLEEIHRKELNTYV